ncbi:hypothetical protein IMG5_117230 [Ichthyophthirius multifiliis]|uniref:Uncharacterized protein n=1 Tax=Ichthyophthirius multifiliis TaxID=5932 RepID=G0QUH9_ICHMU|nr:hypothetical protein IMG5_117230 [Ichthyophthirius multifiliis]EGR31130.1 hypothetical protein IMG5_117230 [Ichthyophthirius multifiliis]|eukprot:XP_004034616.1 hypothetical protein IMG5_117230 [Ichthyophthirius multifiliis]
MDAPSDYLTNFFANNTALENISFKNCMIYPCFLIKLADGIAQNDVLISLNLSQNFIGDEGVKYLLKEELDILSKEIFQTQDDYDHKSEQFLEELQNKQKQVKDINILLIEQEKIQATELDQIESLIRTENDKINKIKKEIDVLKKEKSEKLTFIENKKNYDFKTFKSNIERKLKEELQKVKNDEMAYDMFNQNVEKIKANITLLQKGILPGSVDEDFEKEKDNEDINKKNNQEKTFQNPIEPLPCVPCKLLIFELFLDLSAGVFIIGEFIEFIYYQGGFSIGNATFGMLFIPILNLFAVILIQIQALVYDF